MKKNTATVAILTVAFTAITIMSFAPSKTSVIVCEPQKTEGLRDQKTFVLDPTMQEEYEDWVKYVSIMEGDTIHITVMEPVYPDPGNDFSNQ